MPKFLDPTGKELTAGQALDVFLAWDESKDRGNIHLFADAVLGFKTPMQIVEKAGIEIKFGEENEVR